MPNPQRFCIFCGGPGLTKEHMFADWFEGYIPRTQTRHGLRSVVATLSGEQENIFMREGDTHSRTVRCVCRPCNNGWMSALQNEAKPFLVPMLHGQATSLRKNAQRTLAAWAAMTAMVGEFAQKGQTAVSQEERSFLYRKGQPPSFWRIWIARAAEVRAPGQSLWHHSAAHLMHPDDDPTNRDPHKSNSQSTTMRFGDHLVLHMMSSSVSTGLFRRWKHPPDILAALAQVWPYKTAVVRWPPQRNLSNSQIAYLGDDLFKRAQRQAHRYPIR